jgi:anti-anti-sigma factor
MKTVYTIERQGSVLVMKIFDLIGEYASKEILQAVEKEIAKGNTKFVVDMSGIVFMNSVGLNGLIGLYHKLEEVGGRMVICNCSEKVNQLLVMTKLNHIFEFAPSVKEGVSRFQ